MEQFRPRTSILLLFIVASILLPLIISTPVATSKNYFWHVTDFHMDLNYTTSGDADQMCWQNKAAPSATPMGSFGDYRCDSPYKLVQSAVNAMKLLGDKPDFILWTGDDKAHVPDVNFDEDKVYDLLKNLTDTLNASFPNVPFVPVLGNHDWFPTHKLPPHNANLYTKIGTLWKPWINESGYQTFSAGGFYTLKLSDGLRFVVLNTALYYRKNTQVELTDSSSDPGGQFKWFDGVMTNAKDKKEKVYVTSHVPPGIFERHIITGGWQWLNDIANKKLIDLVVKHSESIVGLFFAHHHTDSFRIFYDNAGKPVSWMLIAPAVTPWNTTLSSVGPNNPALRKFSYDTQTQEIQTFQQYFLNLTKANEESRADWELEYDAQESYNLGTEGVTPATLDRLVQTFNTKNRTMFDRYYLYNSVSYQSPSECDEVCKRYHYCVMTNVDYSSFSRCQSNGARGRCKYRQYQRQKG